jgi:hypothetical protein
MARSYSISFSAVAVSVEQDLFEITPGDDHPVEIVGLELGQSSDSQDAQDEQLQIQIIRGHTTGGSGGSSVTSPPPMDPSDNTANFAAEVNNTTIASAGTTQALLRTCWNVRAGYINWFPEDCRPVASQSNVTIVVRQSAPADAVTLSGTLYLIER